MYDEKENTAKKLCTKIAGILGFIALCFLYGTSYGIAILGLKTYPGATLTALRMIFAFVASFLIFIGRITFEKKTRLNIQESLRNHKIDMLKSAFGGIMYYGFPHSLIGVAQRSIPSNTVHIAQSCVPFFAFIFANFMLQDEKFSFRKFYPQVLALIGTILTTIPTRDSSYGEKTQPIDYVFVCVAIASFGFGSVYMKSHLAEVEPTLCGLFQLFGSVIYSVSFAIGYDKPSVFISSIRNTTSTSILWPLILGAVHTCGCAYVYLYTVKILGAVISSFSNFGQIVIGILIGIFFFDEWGSYVTSDYIMSGVGLFALTLAIICGFLGDREPKAGIKRDDSMVSLVSEQRDTDSAIPEYDAPGFNKPLLA
ncbi:Integral membrane protein [Tritrichomonas foetus]|uniref:Integral membrane protein n=1 Tax=Tritrichomonas foetus TaxID=1144522 RepID=A0A1J4JY11_9EUKA|nr:Integral membrane protein [Tritrichomonas foetus]|eukprot:OHT02398.1 Integral membrane protein [Tritrichomonas foetus]